MNKKSHSITFPINSETNVFIPLKDPVEWLGPIYQEKIILSHFKDKITLSNLTIYHDMIDLADLLKKAFKNELLLDKSINQDIGYLVHQCHIDETKLTQYIFSTGIISWVGYKYKLWEGNQNNTSTMSWIYNAPDGSIIFEVTPFYPYMFCEPEEEPNYIPYKEWIKTYKPYLITTLSQETAQQWLEQAERIIKIISDNQKRWDYMPKKDFDS